MADRINLAQLFVQVAYTPQPRQAVSQLFAQVAYLAAANPAVSTGGAVVNNLTSATLNGSIGKIGEPVATAFGHVLSRTAGVNLANAEVIIDNGAPTGTGAFQSTANNLVSGAKYYYNSYITSSAGTQYGSESSVDLAFVGWQGKISGVQNPAAIHLGNRQVMASGIAKVYIGAKGQ